MRTVPVPLLVLCLSACGGQAIAPRSGSLCPCERRVEPDEVALAGPSDVAYYLDGESVALGRVELAPGWHVLGVEADGYSTFEHRFYRPEGCGLDLQLVFGPPTRVDERLRCADAEAIRASVPLPEPLPELIGPPTEPAVESHLAQTRRWSDRVVRTIARATAAAQRANDVVPLSCLSDVLDRAHAARGRFSGGEDLADPGVRDHELVRTHIAAEQVRESATEARACLAIDCACIDRARLLR